MAVGQGVCLWWGWVEDVRIGSKVDAKVNMPTELVMGQWWVQLSLIKAWSVVASEFLSAISLVLSLDISVCIRHPGALPLVSQWVSTFVSSQSFVLPAKLPARTCKSYLRHHHRSTGGLPTYLKTLLLSWVKYSCLPASELNGSTIHTFYLFHFRAIATIYQNRVSLNISLKAIE